MICHSYVSFQLRSQQHGEWQRSVESMLRSIEQQLSTASTVMPEAPVETLDAPEVRRHGELVELGQDDKSQLATGGWGKHGKTPSGECVYSALLGLTGL